MWVTRSDSFDPCLLPRIDPGGTLAPHDAVFAHAAEDPPAPHSDATSGCQCEGGQGLDSRLDLAELMREDQALIHIDNGDEGPLPGWYRGTYLSRPPLGTGARLTCHPAGTFARRPDGSDPGTFTTADASVLGREWAHEGDRPRVAWWHRLFTVYCHHVPDRRYILYLDHPVKAGYTMKMKLADLDGWASELVRSMPKCNNGWLRVRG